MDNTFEPSYTDIARDLIKKCDNMLKETDWKTELKAKDDNYTLLESKQYGGYNLPHYRALTFVDLPKETVIGLVWNTEDTKTAQIDDPNITFLQVLDKSANYKIRQQVNQLRSPIWPRETVFYQERVEQGDTTYLIGFSINHPLAPLRKTEVVRTNVAMSVYKYTSITPNKTKVERIANVDPCGWIPTFAIKAQVGKLVNAFNRWVLLGMKQ